MIDRLLYAKLPPHLKRSFSLACLENGTYDQIVAHLERELELSGLENDGEVTIPTMTAVPPTDNQQSTVKQKSYAIIAESQATLNEIVAKG